MLRVDLSVAEFRLQGRMRNQDGETLILGFFVFG